MHFVPTPCRALSLGIFLLASGSSVKWGRIRALLACLQDRSPLEDQQIYLLHQDLVGCGSKTKLQCVSPLHVLCVDFLGV